MKHLIKQSAKKLRKQILMLTDAVIVAASYIVTWVLISGRAGLSSYWGLLVSSCLFFVCCYLIIYGIMGMYDSLWRYAEIVEFFRFMFSAILAVTAFVVTANFMFIENRIPIAVYFMSAMFASILTLMMRLTYRMYRNTKINALGKKRSRVLLIGAGDAASTLLHEIFKSTSSDLNVICAVDDDKSKLNRQIMGINILGTTEDIPALVEQCEIETLLLAIPSLEDHEKKRILNICANTQCNLQILPDIVKLISNGEDLISRIRDVRVEDLLGREEILLAPAANAFIQGNVVMVTGGGGSIGAELCRQIAACNPRRLIVLDIYENSAYAIQQELVRKYGTELDLHIAIASVRDTDKINKLFEKFQPDLVFHAAAHKHVPLMESSPEEAVKNNIFGTLNTVLACEKYNVKKFVLISTDKAVNPTNVMGATKRICEMIVQSFAKTSKTSFVAVRFGNVLGSNGSVLPLFKEQIALGGPVTVTHPDVVRYFMTIPEAVSLVLEAGAMAESGSIYVLDMGEPVKINDLAENLIRLAGFVPGKEIEIKYVGLRPGEKLFEELLQDEESVTITANSKIFIGSTHNISGEQFFEDLKKLKTYANSNNAEKVVEELKRLVPTFAGSSQVF